MAVSGWGQIYIKLDKGSYSPGQQVNGTIYLNLMNTMPGATQVIMSLSGMEDTKLIERKERIEYYYVNGERRSRTEVYYVTHRDSNSFFNHRFPVYTFGTPYIPAGQYSFPISFVMPSGLPSTFNYHFEKHGSNHAKVNYVMTAKIISTQVKANVLCTQSLIINQEQVISTGMQKKERHQIIKSCCCINKGEAVLKTYFEKSEYVPGEMAYMICEVDNSKCKADVEYISGKFIQHIRIHAGSYHDLLKFEHQVMKVNGIKQGEKREGENACRLQVPLRDNRQQAVQPTCRGKLVVNEYSLSNKIKMDACICCDDHPESIANLTVRNADLEYESFVAPSNWNPQVMTAYQIQFSSEFRDPTPADMNGMPGMPAMPGMPPPVPYSGVQQGMPGMPPLAPYPGTQPGMPPQNARAPYGANDQGMPGSQNYPESMQPQNYPDPNQQMPGMPGMPPAPPGNDYPNPNQGMPGMPPQ
jgi:Arrestin (or S-antigen), N-terminal domain